MSEIAEVVLTGRNGDLVFDPQMISALQSKWATRDVMAELLRARLWLLRYPARRPANLWRFVDNWLKKAPAVVRPQTVVNAWWTSDERTIQQGHALGLSARPGESMAQFRERLSERIRGSDGKAA